MITLSWSSADKHGSTSTFFEGSFSPDFGKIVIKPFTIGIFLHAQVILDYEPATTPEQNARHEFELRS